MTQDEKWMEKYEDITNDVEKKLKHSKKTKQITRSDKKPSHICMCK